MRKVNLSILILFVLSSCSVFEKSKKRTIASSHSCVQYERKLEQKIISLGFPVFSLMEHLWDERDKITYLSEKGRLEYQVFVNCSGLLVDISGKPLHSPSNHIITNPVRAIYVVDIKGRMFLSFYHPIGVFHHSSLVAGEDVLVAGEMVLVDGKIDLINNHSGHYRPSNRSLDLLIDALDSLNVKINEVE
jgi:hypothetical protein